MKIRKFIPAIGFLTLLFAALACNLPLIEGDSPALIGATLTPPPTSEFITVDALPDPDYFAEEFDSGFPEDWATNPGWSAQNGILSSGNGDALLEIPGEWQDLSLFTRLKFNSENISLQFNRSDPGFYALTFSQENIHLVWQPADGEPESLSIVQTSIDTGWHDLVVRQAHGKVEVILDGEPLLKQFDLGLSPAGSIALTKTGAGELEIDRIVLAPAGMGPGSPTPTPGAPQSRLDLALVEVSVEEGGELIVWLINNGPDSTLGHSLSLTITIAAAEPALAIIGDPIPVLMDVEWVNLFPVETGIFLDALHSAQPVGVTLQAFDFNDPDPSNDQLEQLVPEMP